jgi:hypothetical protein
MFASQSDRLIFGLIVVLIGSTAAPARVLAAEKARDWKTGKVLGSAVDKGTYATGSTTSGSINGTVSPDYGGGSTLNATTTANTRVRNVTVKTNTLIILGDDYAYTIEDATQRTDSLRAGSLLGTALANRKHGCRFIVGEDIKYAQEKDRLYILDADGKECRLDILRQEKLH